MKVKVSPRGRGGRKICVVTGTIGQWPREERAIMRMALIFAGKPQDIYVTSKCQKVGVWQWMWDLIEEGGLVKELGPGARPPQDAIITSLFSFWDKLVGPELARAVSLRDGGLCTVVAVGWDRGKPEVGYNLEGDGRNELH